MACSFPRMLDSNRFYSARNNLACGLIWTLMCISLLIFNACTTDGYELITPHKKLVLNLKLNLSGQSTRSNESTETVNLTEGSEIENLIDEEDLWIGVFDSNNHKKIDAKYSLNQIDNTVSIAIATGEYYSEEIQLVACANWSRYGISNNVLESVKTVSELNDITFSFNPENLISDVADNLIDYYPLPMYGSTICSVNLESNEISIDMIRALAKIEIVDNLQGDVKIESAELVRYSTEGYLVPQTSNSGDNLINLSTSAEKSASDVGNNLTFNKITDSSNLNTFYVYIPEMNLGDVDSDYRKIILTLTDNKKSEICLINYSEGLPSTEPNEKWQSLNRNHIYRFNVKELTSTEPEIQIQPTIRICWYEALCGKFASSYTHLLMLSVNTSNKLLNQYETQATRVSNKLTLNGEVFSGIYSNYIEFKLRDDVLFNDLIYILNQKGSVPNYYEDYIRPLHLDIVKYENVEETTYCWLNLIPYGYIEYANIRETYFRNDIKHRIYWRGISNQTYKVELTIPYSSEQKIVPLSEKGFLYDGQRDLYYYDFIVDGNNVSEVKCNLRNNIINVTVTTHSFSSETINGEEYYVFYAN